MGDIVIHPAFWDKLFAKQKHPICPLCRNELMRSDSIVFETTEHGALFVVHARCSDEPEQEEV